LRHSSPLVLNADEFMALVGSDGEAMQPNGKFWRHRIVEILDYLSLGILIMGLTLAFYAFLYIHDIPYMIAKKHNHPHCEAIHAACWLSVFTLHAIWPIVFIWAMMKEAPFASSGSGSSSTSDLDISQRLSLLEQRIAVFESSALRADKREAESHD